MKKILFLITAAVAVSACNNSNEGYVLTGSIDQSYNGSKAILVQDDKRDTTVVENGSFSFKGDCDIPAIATVFAQKENDYVKGEVILERGNVSIVFNADGTSTCSGTPLNKVYDEATSKLTDLSDKFNAEYTQIKERTDIAAEVVYAKLDSLYNKFSIDNFNIMSELFTNNKDNVIGASVMSNLYSDKKTFDSLYNVAGDAVRNNIRVVSEKKRFDNLDKTAEGKMFIDFTIENGNADGSSVKLSDYVGKGKYVLVDFWASWCGPCKAEMPNIAEVYKKYKGDKFEVLGIAVWDKRKNTESSLNTLPISWPLIYDAQSIPTEIYGINGIPELILFGPDGTIVARGLRGEEVGKKIAEVLGKK